MIIEVKTREAMKLYGEQIGRSLKGGEVFELIGDVGAGKTTFVKGLAIGLGIEEAVQSPSFTISRVYDARDGLQLVHYDFYRLTDPGILANEVSEMINDITTVTVIEWADIVEGALPENRYSLRFQAPTEAIRTIDVPEDLQAAL